MKKGDMIRGKYRVERLLGRGGNGSVYLCTNTELGNKWALKHIPKENCGSGEMPEVEILKKLYHVSLPRVVDVLRDDQGLYIVESNIEGIDLGSLLKRQGCFPLEKVLDWTLELCDILEYLHGFKPRPIIYRDLKPSNIMLSRGNRLVLVDFGISKEYNGTHRQDNCIAGTDSYAAPEQLVRGGFTDSRTDIYNLGATIYQLLYGKLPELQNIRQMKKKGKALSVMNRVILKCMDSRPEDRYQGIEAVREDLLQIRNILAVGAKGRDTLYKLETALVILFSAATYMLSLFGIMKQIR